MPGKYIEYLDVTNNFYVMKNYTPQELRKKMLTALYHQLTSWEDNFCAKDYVLDDFYREIANLPDRPLDRDPLVGFFPPKATVKKLFNGQKIPEHQLNRSNYLQINCSVLGWLTVTGGFMEKHGHSWKNSCKAIFDDGKICKLPPSDRNLGIDYVTPDIKAWYKGTCTSVRWESGYGNRAYFTWDVKYTYQKHSYPVYGAFAHAKSFSVKPGDRVTQGELIGKQGSTGGNYPPHIDYRQWIEVSNQIIDLSPNALERQLHE